MWKKVILATISYFIITMATAYPWHLVWFHETYQSIGAVTREPVIVPLGMLAVVTQGFVIAVLYGRWQRDGPPIVEGIKFNLFAGLLVYTTQGFAMAAKIDINPVSTYLVYHTIFQAIQFIIAGAALGAIFGRRNSDGHHVPGKE
jgi:hypothetical protein